MCVYVTITVFKIRNVSYSSESQNLVHALAYGAQ